MLHAKISYDGGPAIQWKLFHFHGTDANALSGHKPSTPYQELFIPRRIMVVPYSTSVQQQGRVPASFGQMLLPRADETNRVLDAAIQAAADPFRGVTWSAA